MHETFVSRVAAISLSRCCVLGAWLVDSRSEQLVYTLMRMGLPEELLDTFAPTAHGVDRTRCNAEMVREIALAETVREILKGSTS